MSFGSQLDFCNLQRPAVPARQPTSPPSPSRLPSLRPSFFTLLLAAIIAIILHSPPSLPVLKANPAEPPASSSRPLIIRSVEIAHPYIALTFDDGPHPTLTPRLLDLLAERKIRATFYVIGQNVQTHPAIARRIVEEGHEIANHTWSHPTLTKLGNEKIISEIQKTEEAIFNATGVRSTNFRPPYGAINDRVSSLIQTQFGFPIILWSVDPEDWKRPGSNVVTQRLVDGATNGAILLAHDIQPQTIDAMPATLDQLIARGFQFITVSQLLSLHQPSPPPALAEQTTTPSSPPATTPEASVETATGLPDPARLLPVRTNLPAPPPRLPSRSE